MHSLKVIPNFALEHAKNVLFYDVSSTGSVRQERDHDRKLNLSLNINILFILS